MGLSAYGTAAFALFLSRIIYVLTKLVCEAQSELA